MSSRTECTGTAGFTTSSSGAEASIVTAAKSRTVSYGSFATSAGLLMCGLAVRRSVYPSGALRATISEPITLPTARTIVDHNIAAPAFGQLLRKHARKNVGPATRGERHDDSHGLRRIRLRERCAGVG